MAIEKAERERSNPQSILDRAKPGEVATTRTAAELWDSLRSLKLASGREKNGQIFAILKMTPEGDILDRCYWDSEGRIVKSEYIGNQRFPEAAKFVTHYTFDPEGRLAKFEQVVTRQDGTEFTSRREEYKYIAGKPDCEYTLVYFEDHNHPSGPIQAYTVTYEDRQIQRTGQPHQYPPHNP